MLLLCHVCCYDELNEVFIIRVFVMKFIIRRSLIVHCKLSIPGTFFIGGGGVGGRVDGYGERALAVF